MTWPEYNHCRNVNNQLTFDEIESPNKVNDSAICTFWDRLGYVRPYNDPTANTTMSPDTTLERTASAECVGNSTDIHTTHEGDGASQQYRLIWWTTLGAVAMINI